MRSVGSGLGSAGEVVAELGSPMISVGLEDLVLQNEGEGVSVLGVGLVEEDVEADHTESEVSDGGLGADDVVL